MLGVDGRCARSFADLEAESDSVARVLAGLRRGAVVSLYATNSPAWPALALGVWKAECCALLVDRSMNPVAVENAERRCGAQSRLEIDGQGNWHVLKLDHSSQELDGLRPDLIKLTSGTTGEPRPIFFSAEQLVADCDNICETMGIADGDVNYGIVAFSHSYGFSNLVTPLLCRGIALVAAADALPRAIVAGIHATGATVLPSVPSIFQAIAGIEDRMPSLRLCISAGAPLGASVSREFRERFGCKLHSFYGASECGAICYDGSDQAIDADGFVGTPVRGVHLVHGEGNATDGWSISVRSEAVCLSDGDGGLVRGGVFEPPDRLAPYGQGWQVVGRVSDIINVGGRKVNPAEIERVLLSHPGVGEAVVFAVPDASRGQSTVAWVVPLGTMDIGVLMRHCAASLASWQMPREMRCVDFLPRNARGKINRRELCAAHLRWRDGGGSDASA